MTPEQKVTWTAIPIAFLGTALAVLFAMLNMQIVDPDFVLFIACMMNALWVVLIPTFSHFMPLHEERHDTP